MTAMALCLRYTSRRAVSDGHARWRMLPCAARVTSPLRFVLDDLSGGPTRALIARHLAGMHASSPPESVHAFDVDRLREPGVTFYSVWVGEEIAGCGALKALGGDEGELKSMRVADAFL